MTGLVRDNWLSGALARECFRVDGDDTDVVRTGLESLPAGSFVYAKLPVEKVAVCNRLEDARFRIVDTTLTFEGSPGQVEVPVSPSTRMATPEDAAAVAEIATGAFQYSRFHLDPSITRKDADRTRREWAANYFAGHRGDNMVLSTDGHDRPTGFLQLLGPSQGTLVVDLIAVDKAARRTGAARAMLHRALHMFGPMSALRVGTQAANIPSVRLYEELGLRLVGAAYVLHWHSPRAR